VSLGEAALSDASYRDDVDIVRHKQSHHDAVFTPTCMAPMMSNVTGMQQEVDSL